jgi:hypothetical protein
MSKTLKIVKASVGSYTDKEGKTKHRYRTIGSVIETKAGEMLIIDVEPRNWDGRAFLNDPEPSNYQGLPKDDDIDF